MRSLAPDKAPQRTRVVVAMSGGVDSSVTAAMLVAQGYDVIGITLKLFDPGKSFVPEGQCGAGTAIADAARVAQVLSISHHVLDCESRFAKNVMDYFADSYLRGKTPIPCVLCNKGVKFGELMDKARELGAEALATGHYARRIEGEGGIELHRAVDDARDQSYFLFALSREQLEYVRFPLGEMSKTDVRALAARYRLPVAEKPDSQDICFVPDGDYAGAVCRLRPGAVTPGLIVDLEGHTVGRHEGIINFTVGQRRGLNIGGRDGESNEPLYVVRLDSELNQVVVGPREALAQTEVKLNELNWLGADVPGDGLEVAVRLRSAQKPAPARFFRTEGSGRIVLREPAYGVAPGQAGVIYDGSRVLGGGWIAGE
jgi:tRNA-specific 2-thiouridylase